MGKSSSPDKPTGPRPPSGPPGDLYLTQQYEKIFCRKFQDEAPQPLVKTLPTGFVFSSAYPEGKIDAAGAERSLTEHYQKMSTFRQTNPSAHITRTHTMPNSQTVKKVGSYTYGQRSLTNSSFGNFEKPKFTKRVSLKEQRKFGGACMQALGEGDNAEERKPSPEKLWGKIERERLYTMSESDLRAARRRLLQEQSTLESSIAEKMDESVVKRNATQTRVKQLDNFKMKRRPLALRDGEIFGDESLAEIHRCRTKAKTMVKGASTDAMQAIMRSAPRRPETEEKRRDIKPNSNTIRSVEANFDNWKKFL